jgi:glycine hydroxymethyltransferase
MGTPAITNRGMGLQEMKLIAEWIVRVFKYPDDADVKSKVRSDIAALCAKFPIYETLK